jgi:hypothetical protein
MLCIGLVLVATGCGAHASQAILGTWEVSGREQTIEFHQDGTMIVTDITDNTNQVYTGTYIFADSTHINIEITPEVFGLAEIYAEVDIRGNQMILSGHFSPSSQMPTVLILQKR